MAFRAVSAKHCVFETLQRFGDKEDVLVWWQGGDITNGSWLATDDECCHNEIELVIAEAYGKTRWKLNLWVTEILILPLISMAMRKEVARESRLRHPQRISLLDGRGKSMPKPVQFGSWQRLAFTEGMEGLDKRSDGNKIHLDLSLHNRKRASRSEFAS